MTKKRKPTKSAAPNPPSFDDLERAGNAAVERISADLGIDRAEVIRLAKEDIKRIQSRLRGGP
jgi:hypothetical protein